MINFLKNLFCKHNYETKKLLNIWSPYQKDKYAITYHKNCTKCGLPFNGNKGGNHE